MKETSEESGNSIQLAFSMGNSLRKIDLDRTVIDGGPVKSPDAVPMVTLANGVRVRDPNAHDSHKVAKLIVGRKLAPFYEGQFEEKSDAASRVSLRRRTSILSSRSAAQSVHSAAAPAAVQAASNAGSKKKAKGRNKTKDLVDKKWLTHGLVECPICYLVRTICPGRVSNGRSSGTQGTSM